MFPAKMLLSLLLLSLISVDASPISRTTGKATLSFATKITANGARNIVERDQARAQAIMQQASGISGLNLDVEIRKRNESVDITNAAVVYTTEVGIGSPATNYTLLIDTGSSNTWVGAGKAYTPTSTSVDTKNTVSVSYGSGSFSGEEWTDSVTLAPGLTITKQSIGVAKKATGFSGVDGILGVGPVGLTQGTVSKTYQVPTVMDNLYSQRSISQEVLGIYFVPSAEPNNSGELTFGGYDNTVITSPVNYVPHTPTFPASMYWGINQSIAYGNSTILDWTAGIVDTGTTLILIASDAFQKYQTMTGGTMDPTTGLLTITQAQYANLQNMTFNIGGMNYDLTPNAQIWPRQLNTAIGGNSSAIYLVVNSLGSPYGSGLDFINGYTFLERYYSVFDATSGQVGLATTTYTYADIN